MKSFCSLLKYIKLQKFLTVILLFILLILQACQKKTSLSVTYKAEPILRSTQDTALFIEPLAPITKALYPWETETFLTYPKITKEFFRCKGNSLNPFRVEQKGKELLRIYDCVGSQKHSLPLYEGKEFIYPILIDLLNYIQVKMGKRVIITCGHCCPDHYTYLQTNSPSSSSKHLIGAEVDFYLQDLEEYPEKIMSCILEFYQEQPKYQNLKEYQQFQRSQKQDKQCSLAPYYNKEIFVKIFNKNEARDFDNSHSYPYVSIQVCYDWDKKEKVTYSWQKAFNNFHRW